MVFGGAVIDFGSYFIKAIITLKYSLLTLIALQQALSDLCII